MRFSAFLSAGLLLAFSVCSFSLSAAADPKLPKPLEFLQKQGATMRYLGNDTGVDGWLAFKDGQKQYFYVTPDQQSIILGILYNNKGDIITAQQIETLRKKDPAVDTEAAVKQTPAPAPAPAPAADQTGKEATVPASGAIADAAPPPAAMPADKSGPSKSQQLYAEAEAASWISLGQKTAPAIYSFIDPQCPHCHAMINDFRASGLLDKGDVQLRLIPVGLMNETSLKQAANLLASKNAPLALYKHMGGDTTALMEDPDPNTQTVQRNIALFQNWKLDVTPFSIYKDKTGAIKILRGRPDDLKALVAQLK